MRLDDNDNLLEIGEKVQSQVDRGSLFNLDVIDNIDEISHNDHEMKWHLRFMQMAALVASWSKDSTKVGAVAVDHNRIVVATGYNGFPKEIADTIERLEDRELKNQMVVHAEMNVIFNAPTKFSLTSSTFYVYGVPPCNMCTASLVRKKIRRLVILKAHVDRCHEPWASRWFVSRTMLQEADIEIIYL